MLNQIYIGIGSNINKKFNVDLVLKALKTEFNHLIISPLYESPAEGFIGASFYNLVVYFQTKLPLNTLQTYLKKIEYLSGRVRSDRGKTKKIFSDRTLDLDILLFNNEILHDQGIDIPREEIFKYAFVLKPLYDVAPNLLHPKTGESIEHIWINFDKQKKNSLKQIKIDLSNYI